MDEGESRFIFVRRDPRVRQGHALWAVQTLAVARADTSPVARLLPATVVACFAPTAENCSPERVFNLPTIAQTKTTWTN